LFDRLSCDARCVPNSFPWGRPTLSIRIPGDAFVSKLNPTGSELLHSSLFGGDSPESGFGIALDARGDAYVMVLRVRPTSDHMERLPASLRRCRRCF
jgi:hypothetical protein